jgi:hypothetical protein
MKRTAIAIALHLAACGTAVRSATINPPPRAMTPRPPETVQVFSSVLPPRPFVEVAYITAEKASSYSQDSAPEFINRMRERAAEMGCDGLVIRGATELPDWLAGVHEALTGTCIVYQRAAATAGSPGAHEARGRD